MKPIISKLAGKSVLILGLGISGLSMARWCSRNGAIIKIADTRKEPPQLNFLQENFPDILFQGGVLLNEKLLQYNAFDAVLFSPGLSLDQCSAIRKAATLFGIPCVNELDLFAQALSSFRVKYSYLPDVIAITGTNGKTTVTSLTGKLAESAGKKAVVAGNIGPALLDTLLDRFNSDSMPETWVLELSSFQLEGMGGSSEFNEAIFMPKIATILNISQDHLDWHQSMENYIASKYRIYGESTLLLLNRDVPLCNKLPPCRVPHSSFVSFGQNKPERHGDWGIENVNGSDWLVRAEAVDGNPLKSNKESKKLSTSQLAQLTQLAQSASAINLIRLMPVEALKIHGRHNAGNALAALALASSVGCTLAPMLHALKTYEGEPHRVQWIATIEGVEFFDDSKGTNVGATVAALEGLADIGKRRLILIMGGDGKGQDFSPLIIPLQNYAKAVILIGRDANVIHQSIQQPPPQFPGLPAVHHASSLPNAVWAGASLAQTGDIVILSPACASFDMFNGYQHRATVYREAVEKWKLEKQVIS